MGNKKILILGASSFIGQRLFSKLGLEKAVGTYCNNPIPGGIYFNAQTMSIADIVKNPASFSHAIIMLGNTNVNSCAQNIEESNLLNVIKICSLIDELNVMRIVPVFTSTEVVFDGKKGDYIETDPVSPILTYGEQKVKVEQYLQGISNNFLVVRLARVIGDNLGDGSLFASWLDDLENVESLKCAKDQFFSPIYVDDVVDMMISLIMSGHKGIYHISGTEPFSRIELLNMLIRNLKEHISLNIEVIPCSINDFTVLEKHPHNVSLIPDKVMKSTTIKPLDMNVLCRKIVSDWYEKSLKG